MPDCVHVKGSMNVGFVSISEVLIEWLENHWNRIYFGSFFNPETVA